MARLIKCDACGKTEDIDAVKTSGLFGNVLHVAFGPNEIKLEPCSAKCARAILDDLGKKWADRWETVFGVGTAPR